MTEQAARIRRIRDQLKTGGTLSPEDQTAIAGAIELSERHGMPLERALRWPTHWRSHVRFLDALAAPDLSSLCVGRSCRSDARSIMRNPFAMKQLTIANSGKKPGFEKIRRALSSLGSNYASETTPTFSTDGQPTGRLQA